MKQKPLSDCMMPFLEGKMLLFNKPIGWTSFDIVKKIRIITGISKVGHAGTLDPLASGLLIVCTGKATKQINYYMGMPKEYTGTLILGATTASYDRETELQDLKPFEHIKKEKIEEVMPGFIGEIMQVPPAHSAIKLEGKRVYIDARKGIEVKLDPRPVTIHSFEITAIELPVLHFKVTCSTGTYIRSLANDFGKALGPGAYLGSLYRTKIGNYSLNDAKEITEFELEIKALLMLSEGQSNT